MLKNVSSQNNKKYVPPRYSTNPFSITEKKSLKKEFALQPEAFPALTGLSQPTSHPILSFAQAAQTTKETKTVKDTELLLPGWLYLRRKNGKIEYKSGPTDPQRYPSLETAEEADNRLSRLLLKYRLAREQYVRDNDVLHLGDYSEYYNIKTLQEQFDEEDIVMLKTEYRSSDSSDTE
jgi:predicted nucleic acid-binding protein